MAELVELMDFTKFKQEAQKRATEFLPAGDKKELELKEEHQFGYDFIRKGFKSDWLSTYYHGTSWENACDILKA